MGIPPNIPQIHFKWIFHSANSIFGYLIAAEQRKMGKRTSWCTMASPGLKTFNVRNLVAASSYVETMLLSRHSELSRTRRFAVSFQKCGFSKCVCL